jgi:integrase
MLVEDHLRPAAKQVIEIPPGHRFGFHNLRHALTSFLVEIGTDPKTIQDMLRWADPSATSIPEGDFTTSLYQFGNPANFLEAVSG